MTDVDFDEFVRLRSGRLLRLAYALTHDHALAEDLLQTAYAQCWRSWRAIEGDPEPYLRRALVNTNNSWWRRRHNRELVVGDLPETPSPDRQDDVVSRDRVWRALAQLPRQQQTVLVLRYYEDLSEAQIAEIMQVSPGSVKGYAAKALARLRTDPTLSTVELPDPGPAPDGTERLAGVHGRIRRGRRLRTAITAAVVAAILVLVAGAVAGAHLGHRNPHPLQPTPSPSAVAGSAADYHEGRHLLTQFPPRSFSTPDADESWTVPADGAYAIVIACTQDGGPAAEVRASVGLPDYLYPTPCSTGAGVPAPWWQTATPIPLSAARTHSGQTVRLRARVNTVETGRQLPAGIYALGVIELLDLVRFPLPTAPASLPALPHGSEAPWMSSFDVDRRESPVKRLPGPLVIRAYAESPMTLTVRLDGFPVGTITIYDYAGAAHVACFDRGAYVFSPDEPVPVRIGSDSMRDWFAEFDPPGVSCPPTWPSVDQADSPTPRPAR